MKTIRNSLISCNTSFILLVTVSVAENNTQEQSKSLDADSSKDLKALLSHNDDESDTTTAKPATKHSSHSTQSSKAHSKSKAAVTQLTNATVTPSSQTLAAKNEAMKNESFLQASLGQINPVTQQTQLSSVMSGISPQDAPVTPAQEAQSNVSGLVSALLIILNTLNNFSS